MTISTVHHEAIATKQEFFAVLSDSETSDLHKPFQRLSYIGSLSIKNALHILFLDVHYELYCQGGIEVFFWGGNRGKIADCPLKNN